MKTGPEAGPSTLGIDQGADGLVGRLTAEVADRNDLRSLTTELNRRIELDRLIQNATGRWQPGRPDPERFVPGDVCALRSISVGSDLHRASEILRLASRHSLGRMAPPSSLVDRVSFAMMLIGMDQLVYEAEPFFLEADAALAVTDSAPPPAELLSELRLPFESVLVVFGSDLALPDDVVWPQGTAERAADQRSGRESVGGSYATDVIAAMYERGGYVTGVVLEAGPDGTGLSDRLVWLVAAAPDPSQPHPADLDRQRGIVIGDRRLSLLAPVVDNLAAALTWGSWNTATPPPDMAEPGSRAWRRSLATGSVRRREPQGALLGVRVLDLERTAAQGARSAPVADRRSPATHHRRAHWRRVRIGPTSDWHYEGRWIAPTLVNPGGPVSQRPRVYRLPSAWLDRPEGDEG